MENTDVTSALKDAIGSVLEEVRKVPPVQTQNPTQHVVLHQAEAPKPAPWHAWACVTSVIIMFVLTCVMMVAYLDIRAEQRETAAHLRTMYMLIPDLRELVNKNLDPAESKQE